MSNFVVVRLLLDAGHLVCVDACIHTTEGRSYSGTGFFMIVRLTVNCSLPDRISFALKIYFFRSFRLNLRSALLSKHPLVGIPYRKNFGIRSEGLHFSR